MGLNFGHALRKTLLEQIMTREQGSCQWAQYPPPPFLEQKKACMDRVKAITIRHKFEWKTTLLIEKPQQGWVGTATLEANN